MFAQEASLINAIVNSEGIHEKVQRIVSEGNSDSSLVGEQLWIALVYGGVGLGVEESYKYVIQAFSEVVTALRDLVGKLDGLIATQDDMETLTSLSRTRAEFADMLSKRAEHLTDMFVAEAQRVYGIPKDLLLSDSPPDEYNEVALQTVGHRAYRVSPDVFTAWLVMKRLDKLGQIRCRCPVCIKREHINYAVSKGNDIPTPDQEMETAIDAAGSLSQVFSNYAIYLAEFLRIQLEGAKLGVVSNHGESSKAADIAAGFMNSLLKKR